MSDNINGFPVPEEPETREEQYLSAIAQVTPATQIPPEPLTRVEAYLDKIVENGTGGGGGGTTNYNALENKPQINSHELSGNKSSSDLGLQDQVLGAWTAGTATTHSTPASTDTVLQALEKIDNNQRLDETNISLCQAFTNNATIDSDKKLYISATEPTGDIPEGSTWINGATIKAYHVSNNLFNKDGENSIKDWYIYNASPYDIRGSQAGSKSIVIPCEPSTIYTISYPEEPSGTLVRVITTPNPPEVGDSGNNFTSQYGGTSITITTGNDARYIIAFIWDANNHPDMTVDTFLAEVMVNVGSTALPYEPYGNSWQ